MNRNEIMIAVEKELAIAKNKFPQWPTHIVSKASIVAEEAGELLKAALEHKYQPGKNGKTRAQQKKEMQDEAVQTIVVAFRFLENLK